MNFDTYDWGDCRFPLSYCKPLYEFLKQHKFKRGLEIGFDSGSSALVFLGSQPDAELSSVDIRPGYELMEGIGLIGNPKFGPINTRFKLIQSDSHEFMKRLIQDKRTFDYIYVDGDHLYEGVKKDLKDAVRLLAPGGTLVIDDCVEGHGLFGVFQAVQELIAELKESSTTFSVQPIPGHVNRALAITIQ